MRIVRDLSHCPAAAKHAVIALGNFDGVHLGHRAILRRCVGEAKRLGVPAAAMTFEPHPREFFAPEQPPLRLYPFRSKANFIAELGIDTLFVVRFNARFAATSAGEFIETILHRQLNASHIVTGSNFFFGQGRQGHQESLSAAAAQLGFGYSALPPVEIGGEVISSSAIRSALAAGDTAAASRLLGRAYTISGHVRRGEQRGRLLGFPTLNIDITHLFKPKFGVYVARVRLGDDPAWHKAVSNIGIKPTFGVHAPVLEVHCFGLNQQLYGMRVTVELLDHLRGEEKFGSLDALTAQIAADCKRAQQLLA